MVKLPQALLKLALNGVPEAHMVEGKNRLP